MNQKKSVTFSKLLLFSGFEGFIDSILLIENEKTVIDNSIPIWEFLLSFHFLTIFFTSILVSILINFFIQVNKKFGQGELREVISGKADRFQRSLLVSEEIINHLQHLKWEKEEMGDIHLRGKEQRIRIYALREK